jgi:hypothetical protein
VNSSSIHELLVASDVSTARSERTAQVLNERSGDEIGTDVRRLLVFHELAVTVVYEDNEVATFLLVFLLYVVT